MLFSGKKKDSELVLPDFLYELLNTKLTVQAPLGL